MSADGSIWTDGADMGAAASLAPLLGWEPRAAEIGADDAVDHAPLAAPDGERTQTALAEAAHVALDAVLARRRLAGSSASAELRGLTLLLETLPHAPIEHLIVVLHEARQRGCHVYFLGDDAATACAAGYFAHDLGSEGMRAERASAARLLSAMCPGDVAVAIVASSSASDAGTLYEALATARSAGVVTAEITTTVPDIASVAPSAPVRLAAHVAIPCASAGRARGLHLFLEYLTCMALRELSRARVD